MVQVVHLMVQFSRDTIPLMVSFGHLIVQFSRDTIQLMVMVQVVHLMVQFSRDTVPFYGQYLFSCQLYLTACFPQIHFVLLNKPDEA